MDELQLGPGDGLAHDDFALEAILSLRKTWTRKHRGFRFKLDKWGEGPSRIRFADLGLDINIQSRYLSAVCALHGRFHMLWTAPAIAPRPDRIECPGNRKVPCGQECGVDYVYEPAKSEAAGKP
jgi:hypothetical protein